MAVNVTYVQKLRNVTLILPAWVVKEAIADAKKQARSASKIIGLILEEYYNERGE